MKIPLVEITDICQLAKIAQRGSDEAFTEVYKRFNKWVYFRAYKMLYCHEDAEEAVNDVFLKLWQNFSKWDDEHVKFHTMV